MFAAGPSKRVFEIRVIVNRYEWIAIECVRECLPALQADRIDLFRRCAASVVNSRFAASFKCLLDADAVVTNSTVGFEPD